MTALLSSHLRSFCREQPDANILVLAEENTSSSDIENLAQLLNGSAFKPRITLCCNRYDIYQLALSKNINCDFSDFRLRELYSDDSVDAIYLTLPKEKALVHHIFNQCVKLLKPSASLLFMGKKNQGIKSYADKLKKNLALRGQLKKHGDEYLAHFFQHSHTPYTSDLLDDKNYAELRTMGLIEGYEWWSKPGIYGWEKIDAGSQLLVECLEQHCQFSEATSAVDLGCGYGFLSMVLLAKGIGTIYATDNNAAAVVAADKNLEGMALSRDPLMGKVRTHVSADDCGAGLSDKVDLVVCNPPFHQGFNTESHLSKRFLAKAAQLLKPRGKAYFVVNAFLPIEKLAEEYFASVTPLVNDKKFKVIQLAL